jgi:hypothetical protein
VRVERREPQNQVLVSIRDTGVGIPSERLSKIFDPFFTTKPVGVGTGLGLSICRNITEALGGCIEVTSEVGVGSTFSVSLPYSVQRATSLAQPSSRPPAQTTRSLRVLVVDDDVFVARSIRRLLRPQHDVTLAEQILPMAIEGLELLGIDGADVRRYLEIAGARVRLGQNGATWQRAFVERHGTDPSRLLARYMSLQRSGLPVHEWPVQKAGPAC